MYRCTNDGIFADNSISHIHDICCQTIVNDADACFTRKPSWRKGKRATAVRVRKPVAKKSTAN